MGAAWARQIPQRRSSPGDDRDPRHSRELGVAGAGGGASDESSGSRHRQSPVISRAVDETRQDARLSSAVARSAGASCSRSVGQLARRLSGPIAVASTRLRRYRLGIVGSDADDRRWSLLERRVQVSGTYRSWYLPS